MRLQQLFRRDFCHDGHTHEPAILPLALIKSQKDPGGRGPGCGQVPEVKGSMSFLPAVRFPQRAGHCHRIFHIQLFAEQDFSGHGTVEPIELREWFTRQGSAFGLAGPSFLHALDNGDVNVRIRLLQCGDVGLGINRLRSLNFRNDGLLLHASGVKRLDIVDC
jgi:hypothetical protein